MISKIKHIKDVGRFRNFSCSGDQTLRKLNLLFGENGRGKTTISAILRSLSSGDPSYIQERHTLGSTGTPDIEILLPSGMAKFDGASWTPTHGNIAIFDHRFIIENIHVGENVETDNRRGLASVILGKRGTEISVRIKEQDEIARQKAAELRVAEDQIGRRLQGSMTIQEFIDLAADPDIEIKINTKESDLAAATRASSLRLQQLITELPLPRLPEGFAAALAETIGTVSAAAEKKVKDHLKAEHMKDAEDWLSQGVDYMEGPDCPVCGRPVEGLELVAAYKDYFSEGYAILRDRIADLEYQLASSLGEEYEADYSATVENNESQAAFWSEFIPLSLPDAPDISGFSGLRKAAYEQASGLLNKKKSSLLESVPIASFSAPLAHLMKACESVVVYNEAVKKANEKITELKTKSASADAASVKSDLAYLYAIKDRQTEEVKNLIAQREAHKNDRQAAVNGRQTAQNDLSTYSHAVMVACEGRINELLADFGAGFKISGVEASFPAGQAASAYSIEINGEAVEAGSRPRTATPSFQTMLSAGDKNALALAFFFAAIDQDSTKSSKVIFLDDPFNSQDEHRRSQTSKLIHKYTTECAQVLVSSHNPDFLRLVWNSADSATTKCLKLRRDGENDTLIEEWDIERSTKHPYLRLHDDLTQYMAGTIILSPSDAIQKLRPLLEDYVRFRFPNIFQWDQWLGDMILYFKAQGAGHPMFTHITALSDINGYTSPAHHASIPVNETELRTHIQRTLSIVGRT